MLGTSTLKRTMSKKYRRFTEKELLSIYSTDSIEEAVNKAIAKGYELISVSYVGGCKASGYHVYHFLY